MANIRAGWVRPDPADAPIIRPGPCDRPWLFNRVFAVDRVWQRLISRTINLDPFIVQEGVGPRGLNWPVTIGIHQLAKSVLLIHNVTETTTQDTVIMADMFGTNLNPSCELSEEVAREYFKQIVKAHFHDIDKTENVPEHAKLADWFAISNAEWLQIPSTDPFTGRNQTRLGLPDHFPPTKEELAGLSVELLGQFWFILANYPVDYLRGDRFRMRVTVLLVSLLVSVAKQGCVSDQYVRKITDGLRTDFGQDIDIDREVCKNFYQRYGSEITDLNIKYLLDRWISFLPDAAMRMILTLIQASGSGLTCFVSIGRAIKLFPTFNWQEIFRILPADIELFKIAVGAVGNNQWYGFKKDLGPARSTNFKSLGWVSKELLVKGKGETALNQYRGWPQRVPQADKIRWLINKYLNIPVADDDAFGDFERHAENQVTDDLLQRIIANNNVFV